MPEEKLLEALQNAALAVSSARGDRIFQELTRYLATILHCDLALIGEVHGTQVRTLGVHGREGYLENFEYPLAITPCGDVVGKSFMLIPRAVAERYPEDEPLVKLGANGYAGYPLNDPDGHPIGVLAIVSKKPMVNPGLVESVMKIFAVRAEAEMARRAQEQALASSEEQYRAIFNAAADALVLRDAEFRIVDVNPAYVTLSGYSREEVIGRPHVITNPAVEDMIRAAHARALAGEQVVVESERISKDGTRRDVELRVTPIEWRGLPHVLYIGRDITARRTAEEQLRASEEQYRSIFNAVADSLVLRDAEFRIVDVNPAYVTLSGYSREEVIGHDHVIANPAADEARILALHRRALAGEPVIIETSRIAKNGSVRNVELRGVPIEYRGAPHVLYIGRDISERKRSEQALRDSEEQYRAIFNAAADSLVLRDDTGRIVDVNAAMCAMSGYTREEVLGHRQWIFARPELTPLAAEMFHRVIAGESVQFELKAARKDGTPLDIEMRAVPVMYRGKPHALGMARDITARKRAEAERSALELQLRQAQKMEAIGHLTGGIAHDFNNLLASIMGHIVLAQEREAQRSGVGGDLKMSRYLDQSLASARKARDLIRQMLTFSRGQRSTPRAVNLAQAVEESLRLLRGSLPATVDLCSFLDIEQAGVMVDPVQLDQVLLNLAINARDAMGGDGSLTVGVHARPAVEAVCASCRQRFSGGYVELSVADSGPGIPPEVTQRMFEPFFTTKEVGRGSGMGLATVHGIVHEHGGHVVVEPGHPKGTRFRILLPTAAAPVAPAPEEKSIPRAAPARLQGRILVIDDEAPVAEFMRDLLEGWGIEATAMTNARDALEAFTANPGAYDLVITDQTMPGTTGFSLARELLGKRPDLPVILCTGHLDAVARRELESAGIRALLHKPVEPEELYGLLRTELQ